MQEQDRIWTLLGRKLAGEATTRELEELELLIQQHPEFAFQIESVMEYWHVNTPNHPQDAEAAFDRLMQKRKSLRPATPIAQRVTWKKRQSTGDRLFQTLRNKTGLLNSYVKTSCRTLLRNKTFSSINIIGLAVGMAGAMLLLLWIHHIVSYDTFNAKRDRIYQVYSREKHDGQVNVWSNTAHPLAPVLKAKWPQVEEAVRLNWVAAFVLKNGDKQLQGQGFLTDPTFFNVFDYPLLRGNPQSALVDKYSIVLTQDAAQRLFGQEDALGKTIRIDSNINFTVTAILDKLPNNSSFRFDYLIPWSYMKDVKWENNEWGSSSISTMVLLKEGVTEATANKLLVNTIKESDPRVGTEIFLHPMKKWHLWSRFENGQAVGGGIEIARLMGIIAMFILLIACINYMNMSTARSEKRAKEVGIRKVSGAGRSSLILQFVSESLMISLVAGVLGLLIAQSALHWFNNLTGEELKIPYTNPVFWLAALGFVVLTGVLAGSYPAFYLSAFRPVKVLKGTFKAAHALVTPRKVLVVVQFTFAIMFIICTLVIYKQIIHVKQRDIGVNLDKLAFVYIKGDMSKQFPHIKRDLLQQGLATDVTRTNSPITDIWTNTDSYSWEGKQPNQRMYFAQFLADEDFARTMGIKIVAGRDINPTKYATDSSAVLLSEMAVQQMGLKQPIGATIKQGEVDWHVVGVVSNFLPGSPFEPVAPIVLQGPSKDWFGAISFRLQDDSKATLTKIEKIFKKYSPDYPFDYYFATDVHKRKFTGEQNTGELATVFAGLTILISCLGLFALATYTAESRIKEVGVRKVLGASVSALVALLSTGFLKLVLVAFAVASPIAWWLMHAWLGHFAYRIDIGWWIFGLTGAISLLIAVCTVAWQAVRAATANPVKALRNE